MRRIPGAVAAIAGLVTIAFGIWAIAGPRSFYDQVATWPPYNHHFLHDIGAFQIGLGATLLLALFVRDALLLALTGVGTASVLHAIVHAIDRDLGGNASDPYLLGTLAAAIVAGAVIRARELSRRTPRS